MKKRLCLLLSILILIFLFAGCVRNENPVIESLDDLDGRKVGIVLGTIHDKVVSERLPGAEQVFFNNEIDGTAALESGRIDALVRTLGSGQFIIYANPNLTMLDDHLLDTEVGFALPKTDNGRLLDEQLSEFIQRLQESGELQRIRDKWFAEDESGKTIPELTSSGENGTLTMATVGSVVPYNYIRDNEIVGLDVEIAVLFANEYGYGLEIDTMDFGAVIPAVQTGKADFAGACLAITAERMESVDFTVPYIGEATVMLVRDPDAAGDGSLIDRIRVNFDKTFIRENRYLLFLDGIMVTLEINILSVLFGTILGFCVYLICRKGGKIPLLVTRFCVWLIQGMPVVVLLMIVYYIIFGNIAISPVVVSVISFTLVFTAAVYNMINAGVKAVSGGQLEAAYALGFTDTRAFFKIILPQALLHVLPSYRAQVVSLLKATAVVGYISVQDLTRAGDMVRSRTFEPFFSLIAVAVLYFVLAGLMNLFTRLLQHKFDPESRKEEDILKGVVTHD